MEQAKFAGKQVSTRCCIVGGGPAGMIAGFLLARAGVEVVVLEKHADFLRDFRGDTIHPSTMEIMHELGILDEFLQRPHQEVNEIGAQIEDFAVTIADFRHLPTKCKFTALMPQWDFLNFIAEKAKAYPGFHLRMEAEATDLVIEEPGCVAGVRATTPRGQLEVRAELTIGADGRHSIIREKGGLEVIDRGAPIDVLWMRISRDRDDQQRTLGRYRAGKFLVTLDRGDYWQCAYVIPKGGFDDMRRKGIEGFREEIAAVAPFLGPRLGELKDWSQVKLLTVVVDHLRAWSRPGLLCIGDSAHAMSPIGGVGINLAIQDAVAATNILAADLLRGGPVNPDRLREVQRRREYPTRMIQRFQVMAHRRFLGPAVSGQLRFRRLPWALRLVQRFPVLRRIPARLLGVGFRPEHVRTKLAAEPPRA